MNRNAAGCQTSPASYDVENLRSPTYLLLASVPRSDPRNQAPAKRDSTTFLLTYRLSEHQHSHCNDRPDAFRPRDVAECGVYRGSSLVPMAIYLRQKGSPKRVLGFDSFEGFPESIQIDLELGGANLDSDKKVGGLSETSLELVQSKVDRFDLTNVELVKGYFKESLQRYRDHQFSFVHLDCDMYSSYKECLEFFYPRLTSSGVLLLDEYNDPAWPGCNRAVDDFLSGKPEKVQSIVCDNYQKFFFVKCEAAPRRRGASA